MWRARAEMHWAETKACLQESHWGYPEYFEERPFGTLVDAHMTKQVANGAAARMVLYRYDFHEGILGDVRTLNPHGQRRLRRIAQLMRCCDKCPLIIEPSGGRRDLDESRRHHVLEQLANMNSVTSDEMVVVRTPQSAGLRGDEAIAIGDNLIRQTEMGGAGADDAPSISSGIGSSDY